MKTEVEQFLNLNTDEVWSDESKPKSSKGQALPGQKLPMVVATIVAVLAIGACIGLYVDGLLVFARWVPKLETTPQRLRLKPLPSSSSTPAFGPWKWCWRLSR